MRKKIGYLILNQNRRYEVNGREYTCGSSIEYFDDGKWKESDVEHEKGRYYIVNDPKLKLEGLRVRY